MNYAEDRLDRRAAASAVASSSSSGSVYDALEYDLARANIVFQKYYYRSSSSTSFAIYEYDNVENNDDDVELISKGITTRRSAQLQELQEAHELAGRAYRDSGRNGLASYHFGMAWQLCCAAATNSTSNALAAEDVVNTRSSSSSNKDGTVTTTTTEKMNDDTTTTDTTTTTTTMTSWKAVGDYAQMCELSGFPEVGIVALLYYRAGGNPNTVTTVTTNDQNNDDDEDVDIKHNNLKMQQQATSGCNRYRLDEEVPPCYIAFPIDSPIIDELLNALSCCTTTTSSNNNKKTNKGIHNLPTASEILAKLAQIERRRLSGSAAEVVVENNTDIHRSQHSTNIENPNNDIHTFLVNRGIMDNMKSILHFWDDTGGDTTNISNYNNDMQQYRILPPVLQLLLLKLLYSSPIGGSCLQLACIAVPYLAVRYPLSSVDGKDLAKQYKSHWAYYVLVKYLVLGERIKEYRRKATSGGGMRYHIPVWDVVFGLLDESGEERSYDEITCCGDYFRNILRSLTLSLASNSDNTKPSSTTCLPHVISMLPTQYPPLFVVGDSHVLSLSWQTLCINNHSSKTSCCYRTVVPFPATGIKAWHVRPTTLFFTHTNLHTCLHRLPPIVEGGGGKKRRRTIIISAGEIDCREGIGGSLLQGYYHDCNDAITRTVIDYLTSLTNIAHEYKLQILVMPVAPHAYRSQKNGKSMGRARRRETTHLWNETLRRCLQRPNNDDDVVDPRSVYDGIYLLDYHESLQQLDTNSPVGYVLHPSYNADYTHVNSAIIPLVEEAINKSGCDMTQI
jgi:hypothetical protein